MMTLTAWSFTETAWPRTGTCVVSADRTMITCDSRDSYVDPRAALNVESGAHVTRFPCRVLGRDDQGELHCAPGKPTLDYDATEVLRSFARKEALGVMHLWNAPPVVKRYLRTGDPKLRLAAKRAAEDAARGTARGAAWNAAWAAAWATAWDSTAGATAGVVTWAVADATAETAASDAARAAAMDATRTRQSRRLARTLQAGARRGR